MQLFSSSSLIPNNGWINKLQEVADLHIAIGSIYAAMVYMMCHISASGENSSFCCGWWQFRLWRGIIRALLPRYSY
jgi:hypothetical protein